MKRTIPEIFQIPIGEGLEINSTPALAVNLSTSGISDISISSVADKNVLQYSASSSKWVNVPQTDLVDGGNF